MYQMHITHRCNPAQGRETFLYIYIAECKIREGKKPCHCVNMKLGVVVALAAVAAANPEPGILGDIWSFFDDSSSTSAAPAPTSPLDTPTPEPAPTSTYQPPSTHDSPSPTPAQTTSEAPPPETTSSDSGSNALLQLISSLQNVGKSSQQQPAQTSTQQQQQPTQSQQPQQSSQQPSQQQSSSAAPAPSTTSNGGGGSSSQASSSPGTTEAPSSSGGGNVLSTVVTLGSTNSNQGLRSILTGAQGVVGSDAPRTVVTIPVSELRLLTGANATANAAVAQATGPGRMGLAMAAIPGMVAPLAAALL
uniref:ARAD1C42504p n=1 Tax=Blastobotrys adeninivorans TaxID=409370 RepID=A0A060T9A0_BLAAD